jgi:hypothetical protein
MCFSHETEVQNGLLLQIACYTHVLAGGESSNNTQPHTLVNPDEADSKEQEENEGEILAP